MNTLGEKPLWSATTAPLESLPTLRVALRAQVVVIGAGYTGLSAGLHLGEAGRDVVVLDAMDGSREAIVRESADLMYNLVVLWVASGVRPEDVWQEMERREALFGIAEKLQKCANEPKRAFKLSGHRSAARKAR